MEIKKVALVGAGLIGSGWATHLLCKGLREITLYDVEEDALRRAEQTLRQNLLFLQENGTLTAEQVKAYLLLPVYTTNLGSAVKDADLIIENGPENLIIKQGILADIESLCRDDAIITSSTSGIMVSDIVQKARRPQRILGAHPYHPVYLLPLLEIVRNDRLEQPYLDAALAFFEQVDKKPVVLQKDSPGYIGSRLMAALFRESVKLVLEGVCDVEALDTAFTYGPGMRYALMGPFMVYQLTGGAGGIEGLFNGPLWQSVEGWMPHFADWHHWPDNAWEFFLKDCQPAVDAMMAKRPKGMGRTQEELLQFRDEGLLAILKQHRLL